MIYLAKYNIGRKSKELQEATDLTQGGAFADIVAPPRKEGDPTGQTTMLEEQAGAISPTARESTLRERQREGLSSRGMIPPSPMNLAAPTNKVAEPNTAGIPLGLGDNGPAPIQTDTIRNFLIAGKRNFPDPIWDELLEADIDIG